MACSTFSNLHNPFLSRPPSLCLLISINLQIVLNYLFLIWPFSLYLSLIRSLIWIWILLIELVLDYYARNYCYYQSNYTRWKRRRRGNKETMWNSNIQTRSLALCGAWFIKFIWFHFFSSWDPSSSRVWYVWWCWWGGREERCKSNVWVFHIWWNFNRQNVFLMVMWKNIKCWLREGN